MTRRRTRRIAFLAMSFAFVLLSVQVTRAWSSQMSNWCWFWHSQYDVSCTFDSSSGTWSVSGSYDFSQMDENDALALAGDLCDNLYWESLDDCYGTDILEYLYNYHWQQYPEECFITWPAGYSCEIGVGGSFGVACGVFNWCAARRTAQ